MEDGRSSGADAQPPGPIGVVVSPALEAEAPGRQASQTTRLTAPIRDFSATQNASAVVLLGATVVALLWANSPWSDSYERFWQTDFALRLGTAELELDLRHWLNDGLMAFFFFVVGLEIRREFDMGELRDRSRVTTPVLAALGGMAAPALIYVAVNASDSTVRGWGIAMGTDTAFALGVLTVVGGAVSPRTRSFLLTLVIVDDVVALVIIALVYTEDVSFPALGLAAALYVLVLALRRAGVDHGVPYFLVGLGVWVATLASGVHAIIAGVAVGVLATAHPARPDDLRRAGALWRLFREQPTPEFARSASRSLTTAVSPNERLQHLFHPWTSFVIVPLFALANAGVRLDGEVLGDAFTSPVVVGIVLGLVLGKPLGIIGVTWLFTRRRFGGFPMTIAWPPLVGVGTVAGIGFTLSLLIAEITFEGQALESARVGVLAASAIATLGAVLVFRVIDRLPPRWATAGSTRVAAPLVDLSHPVDPEVDHVRGSVDAPVVLVEYADFECPHCHQIEPVLREAVVSFGDDVAFVFRHLPLVDVHPRAETAARAAEAAADQGRFWEMHDRLFVPESSIIFPDLVRYADELGLEVERFTAALIERRHDRRIGRDVASAEASGVSGTPTLFINGRQHQGPLSASALAAAIDGELGAARRDGPSAAARPDSSADAR